MLGQPRRHYASIGSTNDEARNWAHAGAPHGAAVTAGEQTNGHGRRGRQWSSPPDKGLYLSLVLRPKQDWGIARLTILTALAAVDAIAAQGSLEARTKWPNDILLHGKKIGGVLCEAAWKGSELDFVMIGVGLNLNLTAEELPARPQFPASSLLLETGRQWPVEEMAQAWLAAFSSLYAGMAEGDWPRLRDRFQSLCAGLGGPVTVSDESGPFSGIATGLDDEGMLMVLTENGPRRVVAGDVSY